MSQHRERISAAFGASTACQFKALESAMRVVSTLLAAMIVTSCRAGEVRPELYNQRSFALVSYSALRNIDVNSPNPLAFANSANSWAEPVLENTVDEVQ